MNVVLSHASYFDTQNLANTAWSWATLGIVYKLLMRVRPLRILVKMSVPHSQNFSNLIRAHGTVTTLEELITEVAGSHFVENTTASIPLEVTNLGWLYRTVSLASTLTPDGVADEV